MRILLIATNMYDRWMGHEGVRPLPIGLAYVAAYINLQRHSLRVLDFMFCEDYLAATEACVREFRPQLVGVSIRNLDNGSCVNPQSALPIIREVIQRIRGCSNAVISCGGPAFSTLPEACFRYLEPDVGLAGDAAETFALLADQLEQQGPERFLATGVERLSGAVYRQGDTIKTAPHRAASALERPPRLEDLDLEQYRRAGFGVGVITKLDWYSSTVATPTAPVRGRDRKTGDNFRIVRPVDDVVSEVKRLRSRFGLEEFFFIDNAFNHPIGYAKDLCRCLLQEGLSIKWSTNLRPRECDEELVSLMSCAGCQMVLLTGATVPAAVAPGDFAGEVQFATELVGLQRICDLCREENLSYSITQGFGEPGETEDTVRTKLAFLSTIARAETTPCVTLRAGNRLLPGTDLAQRAVAEGIIGDDGDLLMPVFYVAPPVRETLLATLEDAASQHPSWTVI